MIKKELKYNMINALLLFLTSVLVMSSCDNGDKKEVDDVSGFTTTLTPKSKTSPLFRNSIVTTDIDFIKTEDSDAFKTLTFIGQAKKEMPDSRNDVLLDENTYIFNVSFEKGKDIEVWCHSSFGEISKAKEYAEKVCPRLGKLPLIQRDMLSHVVIHKGNETAFAEIGFFVLYSDNMDIRISNNDLEETVFHESVHVSIQAVYEETPEWKQAQVADGNFITDYALSRPGLEDMPETAIFAYTIIKHPERLTADVENWVKNYIPNRLHFFEIVYESIDR